MKPMLAAVDAAFDEVAFTTGIRDDFLDLAIKLLRDCGLREVSLERRALDADLRGRLLITLDGAQIRATLRAMASFGGASFHWPSAPRDDVLDALQMIKVSAAWSGARHARPHKHPEQADGLRAAATTVVIWKEPVGQNQARRPQLLELERALVAWAHQVLLPATPWLRALAKGAPHEYGVKLMAGRNEFKESVQYFGAPLWWAD